MRIKLFHAAHVRSNFFPYQSGFSSVLSLSRKHIIPKTTIKEANNQRTINKPGFRDIILVSLMTIAKNKKAIKKSHLIYFFMSLFMPPSSRPDGNRYFLFWKRGN